MYPKNAASPEPIAIGAVIQISDGSVQSSGVTVRIKPIGVAEGDGGGTTAYSTDGIVFYTPTQAETNYTSFILIAKKTGCIPVSITIITTASSTPGTVILAPTTHTSAVVPTVTTLTNLPAITAGWLTAAGIAADAITDAKVASDVTIASVTGAVGSVTGAVGSVTGNVGGSVGSVTGAVASVTGNVGGNVVGSVGSVSGAVGSISGVTFPSNFSALGINASGHVSRVTLTETLTTYTGNTVQTGDCYPKVDTEIATIITNLATAQTSIDDLPTNAELATALAAADDAVLAAIAALNNLSSAGAASAVTTALTTALTEGYRSTGATGSVRDLLYEINQHLGESEIVGTTKTLKKIDGSTTAKTFTMNSPTTPTSITETT